MRSLLIWFLFAQLGFTNPTSNGDNTGSLEMRRDEPCQGDDKCEERPDEPTAPSDEHVLSHEKRETTKLYTVLVTDIFNDTQISETQMWLESIVKDKPKMRVFEV